MKHIYINASTGRLMRPPIGKFIVHSVDYGLDIKYEYIEDIYIRNQDTEAAEAIHYVSVRRVL